MDAINVQPSTTADPTVNRQSIHDIMFKQKDTPIIVIQLGNVMTDKEVDSELASMSANAKRALLQLIADERDGYALEAASQARVNNALGMSIGNGAYEALTRLIQIINDRSVPSD